MNLENANVVITGASSGIGRAAAYRFAEEGAQVVLAARREKALHDLGSELKQRGADAHVAPTDVTEPEALERLAERSEEAFGPVDVWVNNAAVTCFGRFEEVPAEAFDRVLDTNLRGYVHGARAILPRFQQRDEGVLINVGSVVSMIGQPYTSAYVTSKWAIRGFSECLRMEALDSGVSISTVLPASIDTPLFQNGANYTGKKPQAMEPTYKAKDVADAIVETAQDPKRETIVGNAGYAMAITHAIAPNMAERWMAQNVEEDHFMDQHEEPHDGNLYEPTHEHATVSGGWRNDDNKETLAALAGLAVLGLGAAGALLWRR